MSAELVVPSGRDAVLALDTPTLYQLEQAGEIAREVLDERIAAWTEAGWSQRKIADEIGCSKSEVGRRCLRLGVHSGDARGGIRVLPQAGANDTVPDDAEVVDGELVSDFDYPPMTPSLASPKGHPATGSRTVAGVKFPTGGIADTEDLTAYNTRNLKVVAENLIRRATPKEALALHQLFLKYADMAERKAA